MRICVIGGGVVGCSTAYLLQREGHEVSLVEAAQGVGLGCSRANGGQLSYSYVQPLASPSTLRSVPRLLFDAGGPLRLRLQADHRQWRWMAGFVRACRRSRAAAGTRALLALAQASRVALQHWMRDERLDFAFTQNGKLVICPDHQVLAAQAEQVALQAHAGIEQQLLDRQACIDREPALAAHAGFVGGVWTPSECVADPHLYCQALERAALARGARFMRGLAVTGFVRHRHRVVAVQAGDRQVEADAFVLCAGLQSNELAAMLGERLPVYPIKGYSVTLRMRAQATHPVTSVTDLSRKMVLAPLGGELRVAAMAEIVGHDLSIPPDRVHTMLTAVERIYPGLCDFEDPRPWAGLRPATPDSVPIIRPSRVRNVLLNVGHGALGFTLAAGSACRVAGLLAQQAHEAA